MGLTNSKDTKKEDDKPKLFLNHIKLDLTSITETFEKNKKELATILENISFPKKLEQLSIGANLNFPINSLPNNFDQQLSQLGPLYFLEKNLHQEIDTLNKKLPIQKQIQELFIAHIPIDSRQKKHFSEVTSDMTVKFPPKVMKTGLTFFSTLATIPNAAKQKASGLSAENWFKILSYINIIDGHPAYEALIKCRIILDFYQSKNLIRTLQKKISYAEVINEMPFEALDIFFEEDNGKLAEIKRALEKERLELHRNKDNLKKN